MGSPIVVLLANFFMDSIEIEIFGKNKKHDIYCRYIIEAYIARAITHSRTWKQVHIEIIRSTDVLISNGFKKQEIEKQRNRIMQQFHNGEKNTKETIDLYYNVLFSTIYKEDERIMKQITKMNAIPMNSEKKKKIVI